MAKPTLALIPASQGSKVFSVLPSSGVGDFDFSRGSAATRINSQGLIENVLSGQSRLEYPLIDGVVNGCPSVLLEPQRTNLIPYSEDFSSYSLAAANRVSNFGISPTGTLNATLIYPSSNSSSVGLYVSSPSSTVGTMSCFVKSSGKDFAILGTDNNTSYYCVFDLANESVVYEPTNHEGKIEKYPNGWFRISSTYVSSGGWVFPFIGVADNSSGSVIVDGDNGILIFGLQYEHESYPTSYIPTNGTTVTRLAETANGAGDATTFNDSEGVLMVETKFLENGRLGISNSDNSDEISIGLASSIFYRIRENNASVITEFTGSSEGENHKFALKYNSQQTSIFVDGFEFNTNSTSYSLSGLNELSFIAEVSPFYGKTKQIQYYNSALTDSELEQLTSWISFTDMANGQLYTIE